MPELPEVETIARTLAPQIEGRVITAAHLLQPESLQAGAPLFAALPGARVACVHRRAKLLLVDVLAPGGDGAPLILAFHLKMTGRFFVHPQGTGPGKHTRIIFDLADAQSGALQGRLFFDDIRRFGYCRVMTPEDLPLWPFYASLGPEPLEVSAKDLAVLFAGRRRAIKAVLLDQTVVAGVGNIYADESLFRAGLAPDARASDIAPDALVRLAGAVQEVLRKSIDECGSSIRDYRDANGNAGAFQNSFAVYGKKGAPCPRCGAPLDFARIAGRGSVFCAHCQTR